jgi:diguanylate cyclase (GGDEF)-like protein
VWKKAWISRNWISRSTVERIRLVFCAVGVTNVAVQIPNALRPDTGIVPDVLAVAGAIALAALWIGGVYRGGFPRWAGPVELAAFLCFGLGTAQPAASLGQLFAAVYLRCLFGSHRAAAARSAGYIAVVFTLASLLHSADVTQRPLDMVAWAGPSIVLTTLVVRILSVCLTRLARSRDVNARLADSTRRLSAARAADQAWDVVREGARAIVPDATEVRLAVTGDHASALAGEGAVLLEVSGGNGRLSDGNGQLSERNGRRSDGNGRHGWLRIAAPRPLCAEEREALSVLVSQAAIVLDRLALRAQLAYRASYDTLTALPNRTHFADRLTGAIAERPVAALFIDLDDFKAVNDTLGHAAGDQLLAEVGARLSRSLRSGDVAARLGGDEFAVLVDGVATVADATAVARRILEALSRPFRLDGRFVHVRPSIGIALGAAGRSGPADPAERASTVLSRADLAMYLAKTHGKNRYEVYDEVMAGRA